MPITGPGDVPAAPAGVATFDPSGAMAAASAQVLATAVFRHDGAGNYTPLPFVQWTAIRRAEGPRPSTCQLRVRMGLWGAQATHTRFDDYLALGRPARGLAPDDRVCVSAIDATGGLRFLFDGFVQVPGIEVADRVSDVAYQAAGVEVRAFDEPLFGAAFRDVSDPSGGETVRTMLPTRFNPGGRPNATKSPAYDAGGSEYKSPAFLDATARLVASGDRVPWTLAMAARYVLYGRGRFYFGDFARDEDYVKLPYSSYVDALFTDAGDDIPCHDRTVDGPWPEALYDLIRPHGFTMRWHLATVGGNPETRLALYRVADRTPTKSLYLQPAAAPGESNPIAWGLSNVRRLSLERDAARVVNTFTVEGAPDRVEVGVVLAPNFEVDATDADDGNLKDWRKENAQNTADAAKYREYVADEAGEGHWSWDDEMLVTIPLDLSEIWPDVAGIRPYARRRRPPRDRLLNARDDGKPYDMSLYLLKDYTGDVPGLYDTTGERKLIAGGWRPMRDRLGITITVADPNKWQIGEYDDSTWLRGGIVNLVKNQVSPGAEGRFHLLLVAVIEGDQAPYGYAGRRAVSPTAFTVERRAERRDRYRREWSHTSSPYGAIDARDDTTRLQAEARARRAAHESAPQSGSATVPGLSLAYEVGDRIVGLSGRGVSFAGSADPEDPVYPRVVSLAWTHEAHHVETSLQLADHRGEEGWARGGDLEGDYDA
jgi:hypothetical protein